MTKKERKFYEAPAMTVYEIGRAQILVGSGEGETQDLQDGGNYNW